MLRLISLCLALGSAVAAHAQAGPRTSSLSWVRMPGAEGCVASRPLAEAVEARLGRSVFVSAADAEVAIEGRVEPGAEGGFAARLALAGAAGELLGERDIDTESADCAELTEPLALVIAVMIDPDAAMRERDQPPDGGATEPAGGGATEPPDGGGEAPRERVVVRTERVEVPVEREGPVWQVEIDAAGGAVFGLVADAAPLVYGGVYVTPPRFVGIELGLGLAYMRRSPPGAGATDFLYGFASIAICPLSAGDTLSLAVCGGVHLGATRVSAENADGPPTDERVTVEAALRFRLAWRPARWLAVTLRPALLVPVRRDPYEWSGGTLYAPWVAAPMVDLGAGVRF